jgi:glutaredoxin
MGSRSFWQAERSSAIIIQMILYIKRGCPWCDMAEEWLAQHGHTYQTLDVISDPAAFAEMRGISGQSLAPVLVTAEKRVLSDFGPEELPGFLNKG